MWYEFIRKYDGSAGIEIFENDTLKPLTDIKPLVQMGDGAIYSYVDYYHYDFPIWYCVWRKLNYVYTLCVDSTIMYKTKWENYTFRDGYVYIKGTIAIIVLYGFERKCSNLYVFKSHERCLSTETIREYMSALSYLSQVYSLLSSLNYVEIFHEFEKKL